MVRNGFDRADLMALPIDALMQWKNELDKQLKTESDAMRKARKKK